MAEVKVSQLPETTTTKDTDYYMVVQDGVSRRISFRRILENLKSTFNIIIDLGNIDFYIKKDSTKLLYAKSSTLKVGVKTDSPESDLHVAGNIQAGSASANGVFISSREVVSHPASAPAVAEPITASREITAISAYESSTYTLGAGAAGQTKFIYLRQQDTTDATATISVTNGISFNQIRFTAVGASATLRYDNSKWVVVSSNQASITTV